MKLEKIIYTPENTSAEVIAAIRSRVQHIGDQIILLHEVPMVSPYTAKIIFDEVKEMIRHWDHFSFVLDLRDVQRQDADARNSIAKHSMEVDDKLQDMVIIMGSNFIIRATVTFIIKTTGQKVSKVCGSVEEAVKFIKSKRQPV